MENNILVKTVSKSFFVKMHYNSPLSKELLSSKPKYDGEEISVLQIMPIADGFLLVELVPVEQGQW